METSRNDDPTDMVRGNVEDDSEIDPTDKVGEYVKDE